MTTTVLAERRGPVELLTLNRPDRLNAINPELATALSWRLARVRADREVRAVVLTGAGRAFCAGADIAAMQAMAGPDEFDRWLGLVNTAMNELEELDVPVIAAINGLAFGGGLEAALACDLRVMAETASLGVPEIRIGVLPGAGGTQRLPRLVPEAVAKHMIFTGEPISAGEAHRLGLVNQVTAPGDVLDAAFALADQLAALAPLALAEAKRLVRAAGESDLRTGLAFERRADVALYATEDRVEGMGAFLEKRPPLFRGR
ncbi:MAG: enoyl-CoA hydratase/isomerase family protein [Acidimicrobiales bacterium]